MAEQPPPLPAVSRQGKIALVLFLCLFLLTRLQKLLFAQMQHEAGSWNVVRATTLTSSLALLCMIGVFVALLHRHNSAGPSLPVHRWKWALISIATLWYGSEPVITLWIYLTRMLSGAWTNVLF